MLTKPTILDDEVFSFLNLLKVATLFNTSEPSWTL